MTEILPLSDAQLEDAVGFVVRVNQEPTHNISYFGGAEAEIRADFDTIRPPEGYTYIAISGDGQLTGLLGVELDVELGRCWLMGPLVAHRDWQALAGNLYDAIMAKLPREIVDQEIYCGKQNIRVQEFALAQGFEISAGGAVLTLDLGQRERKPAPKVTPFEERYAPELNELHASLFPNTYYSADQLINLAEEPDKGLFIQTQSGKLAGYTFIQAREAFKDGYIDFLGVVEAFRRQGIALSLVSGALNWVQTFPFAEKATLTVSTENEAALQMYTKLGFQTESVSQAYRKRT